MITITESKLVGCFLNKTQVSFYDDLLNTKHHKGEYYSPQEYMKFEKGLDSHLEEMTCDEYINNCAEHIFNCSVLKVLRGINRDKINKYAESMKQGSEFPMPYLNYVDHQQEGRHRMLAMKEAFGDDSITKVLIVTVADPSDEEIMDYATRKWGSKFADWGFDYCKQALENKKKGI